MSAGRGSLRSALIVAQVAVSFVLLIGAGLMLRSLVRLQAVDAGIRTDSVLSMRVALNFSKYTTPALRAQFLTELADRLRELPGVRSAGARRHVSDERGRRRSSPACAIRGPARGRGGAAAARRSAGGDARATFRRSGIPLLRGRLLDDRDIAEREPVAVISESMARQFFPQGRCRRRADLDRQRPHVDRASSASSATCAARSRRSRSQTFYRPLAQAPLLTVMFLARTSGDPAALVQQMRDAVHAIDPQQPVDQFRTLDDVRSASLSAPRLTATLIGVFAGSRCSSPPPASPA